MPQSVLRPPWPLALLAAAMLSAAAPAAAQDARALAQADRAAQTVEREVNEALARRMLSAEAREFANCPPLGSRHERFRDRSGVTRLYRTEQGSDDSSVATRQYYDREGRLRLVLIEAGAVNGTQLRDRIVFDAAGQRMRETRRRIAGPGYTFSTRWPDSWLVPAPDRSFLSSDPCGIAPQR